MQAVQAAYPQIYFACHTRHPRRRTSDVSLSPSDGTVLMHLGAGPGPTPSGLARHLGIGKPTLSAALKRLEALGYVTRHASPQDRRRVQLALTDSGVVAVRRASVLDAARVRQVLASLTARDRARAVDGLTLLARAARRAGRPRS